MPAMKSRYSLPSTSVIVQPCAWSTTICEKSAIDCRPGAIACASRSKIAFDFGPGTARRGSSRLGAREGFAEERSFKRSVPRRGDNTRTSPEALAQVVRDRLGGLIAVKRVARPRVEIDDHWLAVRPDDRVAAEDLEPEGGGGVDRGLMQASRVERMAQHALVAMIEPLEPVGVRWARAVPDAVEFHQIARHMLLGDDKGYAALGELTQRLTPPGLGSDIHNVVGLGRVEIEPLYPHAVGRPRLY